ncbi:hypothetical protein [Puniceibacterium sp. IMCC21224]|uniref:hypothetical protein n=1 Tax=Puniceibacterium sp. IMCC21224 TaxID=1618204 RepID=UPI00064E0A88|nr:hypothetical protein [Puniceibacterium sp. IMCC21224]KMK67346.1 hypothetical protein IMCC21224_112214 [Puniceibacterium sp. IMCC21224]
MTNFFEPNYTVLTFLVVKKFVYLELLVLICMVRGYAATGLSRAIALLVGLAAAGFVLITFAPALTLSAEAWYPPLARVLAHGQGMTVLLSLSAAFGLTGWLAGWRLWLLDWIHAAMLIGLLGLWAATLF